MHTLLKYNSETLCFAFKRIYSSAQVVCQQVALLPVFCVQLFDLKMARPHGQAKVINYRLIEERSQNLMRVYCCHTVSSIMNAFEKK